MKECKDSGILPCYRDGYGVWHYSDDTHDKVYELNKQMCDIESGLSNDLLGVQMLIADKLAKDVVKGARTLDWAKNMLAGIPEQLSRAKYEILDEILKEKNRLMEEKKTKTMTKAEAFEWLKCKKVHCNNDYRRCCALEEKLFEIGFEWTGGGNTTSSVNCLFIGEDARLSHCVNLEWFRRHIFEELSADDILSIEIVDDEDNIAEKKAFQQARDIMKWLREEQSPHTLMIIDGYHVELLDGVKAEVWKE